MLSYSQQSIDQSDIDAAIQTLQSSHLTQGKEVKAFEKALSEYLGVEYVSVLNSATSALVSAYSAYGIGKGDEVITTPNSFVATANMIVACGAVPVFVDIKYDGNINADKIEAAITDKTKAIVSVDFAGNPVEVQKIRTLCQKYNLHFISDSSHALGSSIDEVKVGNFADATIFSFHAIKPITTFEGGAVATNDPALYEKIELIKSHGIVKKSLWSSDMVSMGYNFRLSDVAAAVGRSQLKRVDSFIAKREKIAHYYDEVFYNNPYFTTIALDKSKKSSRHLYPILLDRSHQCAKEDIFRLLHTKGIGVQVHYKPIHTNSYYKNLLGAQSLPVSIDFYKSELSLPCHQEMSLEDAKLVADSLFEILGKGSLCSNI